MTVEFEHTTLPMALTLTKSVTYPAGTVNLVFSPDGRPSAGDMTARELRASEQGQTP